MEWHYKATGRLKKAVEGGNKRDTKIRKNSDISKSATLQMDDATVDYKSTV